MMDPDMLSALVRKSHDKLEAARTLLEDGKHDDAVSRAYYAVFHAMTALLYREGLVFSRHGQVIGAFNKKFVKTGVFPAEFSRQIDELFKDRQVGDYDPAPDITRETAGRHFGNALKIVEAIVSHMERIRSKGNKNEKP